MNNITLIYFGKLKVPGLDLAYQEYIKRLQRFCMLQLIELKPVKIEDKTGGLKAQIILKEAQLIDEAMKSHKIKGQVWVLDEKGQALKTSEWVQELSDIEQKHAGDLCLIIGGSLGLDATTLARAQKKIAFGPQTFSHELTRVVLAEQLYRALSIKAGHPYHNE